ncbi:MAG: L-serine kinase [Thermoplasmata archaeon]|nr:L-serine kinase [Thermoplasmata archaeon]
MTRHALVLLGWLKAHEEYVEARVVELVERFRRTGLVDYAVVADRETGTVIDGHHRLEALRRLGAHLVPAVLVDYRDASIGIRAWREDEPVPTKDEVMARAAKGHLYPPKTTRHDFIRTLDPADVPLARLREEPQAAEA